MTAAAHIKVMSFPTPWSLEGYVARALLGIAGKPSSGAHSDPGVYIVAWGLLGRPEKKPLWASMYNTSLYILEIEIASQLYLFPPFLDLE